MRFYLTKADGATWADGDGSHWVACFFGVDAGPSWCRILARSHVLKYVSPAAATELAENPVPGEMEPAHETPARAGRTAQLGTANAVEMQFPGTTAIRRQRRLSVVKWSN